MATTQDFTNLMRKVQTAVVEADQALENSRALSGRLERELESIERDYAGSQAKLDRDILETVDRMDEETVRFIQTVERLGAPET